MADPFKDDIIQRIISILSFGKTRTKIRKWAKRRFKHRVYELSGESVIRWIAGRPEGRLQVTEIKAWQIQFAGPMDFIAVVLHDGTAVSWIDEENDLIQILTNVAADRMLQPVDA